MTVAVGIGYLGTRTEDALVAYLRTIVASTVTTLPAYTIAVFPEPCVVVRYTTARGIGEGIYSQERYIDLDVQVRTHVNRVSADAREEHAALVNTVLDALHVAELQDTLNATNPPGVVFSSVMVGENTRAAQENSIVTSIKIEALAAWKEIVTP
jgi:hypothetical protein